MNYNATTNAESADKFQNPTTAMNKALALIAKAFKNVENMNGLSIVSEIANQYGNGNLFTAPDEVNGIDQMQTAADCSRGRSMESKAIQVECEIMAAARKQPYAGTQSEISPSMTQMDQLSNPHTKIAMIMEKEYAFYEWNNWYTKCEECKYDKISYDKAYNDMQQKIERLQAQLGDLKGKSCDTQCASNTLDPLFQKLEDEKVSLESQVLNYAKENAHLKTTYKNLF
ncbi:hypothetical protein Tco_0609999 [Tanacetum coccineum]